MANPLLKSLAQSLNEALLEDVDAVKRSSFTSTDDRTPTFEIAGMPDKHEGTDPMQQSEISEGSSAATKDDEPSHTDSLVSRSLPSSISSASPDMIVSERPVIGKWMATWWIKDKPRRDRPPLSISTPIITDSVFKGSLTPTPTAATSSEPCLESGVTLRAEKPNRRRANKSMFGSLGFSVLNPTLPLSAKKTVRGDDPVIPEAQVQEVEHNGSVHSALSSPTQHILPTTPVPPQLTTSFELPDGDAASSIAVSSVSETRTTQQGASLQAIVNATRVMTKDPTSILVDQGREAGELVANLAMLLVSNARAEGVTTREKFREGKQLKKEIGNSDISMSKGAISSLLNSDAKMTLTKTLSDQSSDNGKSRRAQSSTSYFGSPFFGPFIAEQQRKLSNAVGAVQKSAGIVSSSKSSGLIQSANGDQQSINPQNAQKSRSVPLDSIIPDNAKPPTQYLSKRYVSLTSKDFKPSVQISTAASRYSVHRDDFNTELLTDRYGFVYDVTQYDALLLLRAEQCRNPAPACLTGIKIADRHEEDEWSDDADERQSVVRVVKGSCDCAEDLLDGPSGARARSRDSIRSTPSQTASDRPASSLRRRPSILSSRSRSGTTTSQVAPQIASSKSLSSVLSADADAPEHICEKGVRHLLTQLTEIHDKQEGNRKKDWDVFFKQRSKSRSKNLPSGNTSTSSSGGAAAILGLDSSVEEEELIHSEGLIGFSEMGHSLSREERRELERLIRGGVPLVYRSKIWLECSGALEMMEPGVFNDLLNLQTGEESVLVEIEKDVGRTMPLNVFFGGDGPGIQKLRRVLTAYSRFVILPINVRKSIFAYSYHYTGEILGLDTAKG